MREREPREILGPEVPAGGVDRRSFLRGLVSLGAGGALASVLPPTERAEARVKTKGRRRKHHAATSFPDGVMAGDPRPDGTWLRTRLEAPADGRTLPVLWLVSEDPDMRRIVAGGISFARAAHGHSLKLRVHRLRPDRWYYYQFRAPGAVSQVGRLRTAPARGSMPDRLRYAFCSCQQRNRSFYVAHRAMAEEDIDFFMHLGDYIYVSDFGDLTLEDYRRRWREFQSHPDLQALQARVPIVSMWDDGEFYNGVDASGDPARLAAARQAWFEALPSRPRGNDRAYRMFRWGELADVFMIDVRSYRDPEIPANASLAGFAGQDTRFPPADRMFDEGRTTLGTRQKRWLERRLRRSRARWRFVGNPYNINPWKIQDYDRPQDRATAGPEFVENGGLYVSNEAWDDYAAERREVLEFLEREAIDNVVFTSGHTHFYLASELQADYDDPAARTAAFDFVTGSLTADPHWSEFTDPPNPGLLEVIERIFLLSNDPYLKYVNMFDQGYAVVDVTPEEAIVEYRLLETLDEHATVRTGARFRLVDGGRTLETLFDERPIPRVVPG
jgi:alkaline phosphatase D